MTSPSRNNIASRYLESLGDANLEPTRSPLQPTSKYNTPTSPNRKTSPMGKYKNEDLDTLAQQLNLNSDSSPSKTALIRSRFESPSVTVSAFKSPSARSSPAPSVISSSPTKFNKNAMFANKPQLVLSDDENDEVPSWAKKDYREVLSPSKPVKMGSPSKHISPAKNTSPTKQSSPAKTPSKFASPRREYLDTPSNSTASSSPGYEYLCRIQAIKDWLEIVLEEEITQEPIDLITYIRNGIHLGKLANVIMPTKRNVFTNDSKLQFRHTENINRFFHLLDYMNVPDLFRFELTDLYDAKNVPKVWFCLHAMSYMLNKMYANFPKIENLVGTLEFSDQDIRNANRSLVGTGLPNFASADSGNSNAEEPNTNNFMDKLLDVPKLEPQRQREPEPRAEPVPPVEYHMSVSTRKPRVFVESGIQTDNPFMESTTVKGFNVDASPRKSTTRDYTYLSTPSRDFAIGPRSDFAVDSRHDFATSPIKREDNYERRDRTESEPQALSRSSMRDSDYYTPDIDVHTRHIIKLQSLSRGANFRYKMFVDKIMLKSFADEFNTLFSVIRGNLSRAKTVHRNRGSLLGCLDEIVELQALARAKLSKQSLVEFTSDVSALLVLQSKIRGDNFRDRLKSTRFQLFRSVSNVTELQALVRRNGVFANSSRILANHDAIATQMVEFQSICRRVLFETSGNRVHIDSHFTTKVTQLQAAIRALKVRAHIRSTRRKITKSVQPLEELQAIARGGMSRSRLCNNVLVTLLYEDVILNDLYAKVRANNVRKEFFTKKALLRKYERTSVLPVQTLFRGVMSRFQRDITLEDIYNDVDHVIDFQSVIRGSKARNKISEMYNYYEYNVDKVIRAQAVIRSRFTQQAYKSLINYKSLPLSVVSKFAYLLTDNDVDYQEQMELAELKDKIIEVSKHNEDLENQIENLDIKLSLLDKNKITVEEFIKHKNKYKTYKPAAVAINTKYLERLNKSSRERIELYQSMFYLLQAKPIYFVRLYHSLSIDSKSTQFCKDLQEYVTALFPIKDSSITHHSREEYFFMKFILRLMENDIETNSTNISDLTKAQSGFWVEYFLHFNNHTYQRQHLKSLIGKLVGLVVDSDEMDFESDPSVIHANIAQQEVKVNGFTERSANVSAQLAIKDPEVSEQFVANLMGLREIATELLNLLERNVSRIPMHVRIICNHAYKLSQLSYPEKSDQQHLAVAGVIFIKHYVSTILQYPENFGYLVKDPFNANLYNAKAKDNLKHLSRVMLQVFSMKPFSDNFLKPLNEYVSGSTDTTKNLIISLIDVNDLENEYDSNDYDDIVTHERPKLTMRVNDMISIEKIVNQHIDVMAPRPDDQLYTLSSQLYDVVNSADDYVTLSELGSMSLNLNPTTKEDSLVDSKAESLFTQAKRCILYIMRIQDATGLLELLISGIEPFHEIKFKEMVLTERHESEVSLTNDRRRPYYRTSLGDLTKLTFHELKTMCLQIIIQLETMGLLTRKNSFQELLNQIAIDIKTKDSQRSSRSKQLAIASNTVNKLSDKETFLKRQLSDYNRHIDSILSDLQSKPKDRKFFNIIPVFSKQYFYHRELRKHNRLPKFGSYKYSAKKLLEQDVLIDFGGLMHKAFSSSSKMDFMFSCHEVGKFTIEAANGSVNIPGAFNSVTLDQLLSYQYENKERLELFDGMVLFDTHNLTGLIFRKFYDLKKD